MMAGKMAGVEISDDGKFEGLLVQLPITLRRRALTKAVRAAARVVQTRVRQKCPTGDPTDKPDLKPLRDTIGIAIRDYDERIVAVVGPQHPAGAHGHLVEYGHAEVLWGKRTGRRVPPKPFMRPAADETIAEQQAAVERTIREELEGNG